MEFNIFNNKTNYTEYLQIFCYNELMISKHNDVNIDDYVNFELTDVIVNSFNEWVKNSLFKGSIVESWLNSNPDKIEYFKSNFPEKFKPKVSIWSDRKKTSYYKSKLQDSFLFENFIAKILEENYGMDIGQYMTSEGQYDLGENALGIEIKNDTLIEKYGNVYIEYQEKSNAYKQNYIDSGILKDDNSIYFLIGTEKKFYIFKKQRLIEVFKEEIYNIRNKINSKRGIKFKQIATSKGFVYPVKFAINDTISLDEMVAEIKNIQNANT